MIYGKIYKGFIWCVIMRREVFYNARAYANVMGGPVIAAVGTVALARYVMFPRFDSPMLNIFAWTGATVASLPAQIFAIPVGFGMGCLSIMQLAEADRRKEKALESKIDGVF